MTLRTKSFTCSLILLLMSVVCCTRKPSACPTWRLDSDHATCPQQRSRRLSLLCMTATQNYEIEFIRRWDEDRLYVNLLTFRVPCGEIRMGVEVNDDPVEEYTAQVMEGGQRLLMDAAATNRMLNALWNGCCVKLYVTDRYATIFPSNFADCYRKW